MKSHFFIFLLLASFSILSLASCDEDDIGVPDILSYDGPNATSPQRPIGKNVFAVFFPASEVQQYNGRKLERISFFMSELPARTTVSVYEAASDGFNRNPGTELYRRDLTQRINNTGWIEHILTPSPVTIPEEGIWLAIEVELDAVQRSVGCDQGRNYNSNGDRLYTPPINEWTSFNEIFPSERVNWNIKGILADEE